MTAVLLQGKNSKHGAV